MSSKIEVSRELAERVEHLLLDAFGSTQAGAELRAILDAPVVKRQPGAWMFKNDNNRIERVIWWEPQPDEAPSFWPAPIALYEDPPELAELQATTANLTTELKVTKQALESLKGERADNERLKGGQGEPVVSVPRAWLNQVALMQLSHEDMQDQAVEFLCEPCDEEASQPAPVSVTTYADKCDNCDKITLGLSGSTKWCAYCSGKLSGETVQVEKFAPVKELNQ